MNREKEDHIKLINANIREILSDIILQLDCESSKRQAINETLAFLGDIVQVYASSNEKLMN